MPASILTRDLPPRLRLVLRVVVAAAFALPISLSLGPVVLVASLATPPAVLVALFTGSELLKGLLFGAVWSVAGSAGLFGLWRWILSPRPIAGRAAGIVAGCIVAGLIAITPLAWGVIDGGATTDFNWLAIACFPVGAILVLRLTARAFVGNAPPERS